MSPTDPIRDIIKRTLFNLNFVEQRAAVSGPFEVTQLINSFLGAFVYPWETLKPEIRTLSLDEATAKGWPRIDKELSDDKQPEILGDLFRLMRNGLTHGHIEFPSSGTGEIERIKIWNLNPQGRRTWGAVVTITDMRAFLLRFSEILADGQDEISTTKPPEQTDDAGDGMAPPSFARVARPFSAVDAAHTLVRAAEAVGWNLSDAAAFTRRVQHIEYGLSAEIEFASILRWLGCCSLVHRLNEDKFADAHGDQVEVPDLFVVFRQGALSCTVVVEVKTTEGTNLRLRKTYLDKLKEYARLLGHPLLIAWKPRPLGLWLLIDPTLAKESGEDLMIDLDIALKSDLMSYLAGDFVIIPVDGAGLRIEATRTGEKRATEKGFEAIFTIDKAYNHDGEGHEVLGVPSSVFLSLLSCAEEEDHVTEDSYVLACAVRDTMTRAQKVLRMAVGFLLNDEHRIHWKNVATNLDKILPCTTLRADCQAYFGRLIQYILFLQPQHMPTFVPEGWRHEAGRHTTPNKAGVKRWTHFRSWFPISFGARVIGCVRRFVSR